MSRVWRILLCAALFTLHSSLFTSVMAQTKVITGTVTETLGGAKEPIMGANVVLVNSQGRYVKGAVTDFDGNYNLQVPADSKNLKIRVSYIGMKTITVNYTGQTHQNFSMEGATTIQEVKVVGQRGGRDGMGITRMEQTSAVQKLDLTEIVETSPVTSVEEALQVWTLTSAVTRVPAAASASAVPVRCRHRTSRSSSSTVCLRTWTSARTSTLLPPMRRTSVHC